MPHTHEWEYDRRIKDGADLLTIYKCKTCGTEASGERFKPREAALRPAGTPEEK